MAGKTNSDIIRELQHEVARLIERSDNDRQKFARLESLIEKITDDRDDLRTRLACSKPSNPTSSPPRTRRIVAAGRSG